MSPIKTASVPGRLALAEGADTAEPRFPGLVTTLMQTRQTVLPKRLAAPGPDARELESILACAGTAPDHGQLLPWRLIVVPSSARARLGDVFAEALLERDATATSEQLAQAREKARRAPCLMLVTVNEECGDPQIDLMERIVSAGCAIQNMLLMATALGFGSALTSGKALKSAPLRALFGLTDGEHALCFINMGTVTARRAGRLRPVPADYVRTLSP
jgi:nitroreductase